MFGVDSNERADLKVWRDVNGKVKALADKAIAELEDNYRAVLGDSDDAKLTGDPLGRQIVG